MLNVFDWDSWIYQISFILTIHTTPWHWGTRSHSDTGPREVLQTPARHIETSDGDGAGNLCSECISSLVSFLTGHCCGFVFVAGSHVGYLIWVMPRMYNFSVEREEGAGLARGCNQEELLQSRLWGKCQKFLLNNTTQIGFIRSLSAGDILVTTERYSQRRRIIRLCSGSVWADIVINLSGHHTGTSVNTRTGDHW